MSIKKDKKYHIIYTTCSFEDNMGFARNISKNFNIEIPYIYEDIIGSNIRDHFDSYIYIEENENFGDIYNEICKIYYYVVFTILGVIHGNEIVKMLNKCKEIIKNSVEIGIYYKVIAGEHKNMVIMVNKMLEDETLIGVYYVLGKRFELKENINNLRKYDNEEYINFSQRIQLINLQNKSFTNGDKKAIVIDAYNVLYRNCFNYDRLYNAINNKFVGAAFGFYFTLLKLKEFYPEYDIHVVFDGDGINRSKLFDNNIVYKYHHSNYSEKFWGIFEENKLWAIKFTKAVGFKCYDFNTDGLKVDNVIGSVVERLQKIDYSMIYIYSNNDNYFQLTSNKVRILIPKDKYKEHSHLISIEDVLERFKVGDINKINWYRAIKGNRSYGVPSINMYYNNIKVDNRVIMGTSYLKFIKECSTLDLFIKNMSEKELFKDFMENQFYENYKVMHIQGGLLDNIDLDNFQKPFDYELVKQLLEENSFLREVEVMERTSKIFQGLW